MGTTSMHIFYIYDISMYIGSLVSIHFFYIYFFIGSASPHVCPLDVLKGPEFNYMLFIHSHLRAL